MSRNAIRVFVVAAILAAALFWASPYWAIAGMARAAQAGDAERLSDYIDLPRLKESLKGQVMAQMQSEMKKTSTSGWEALGMALGAVMIDKLIDQLLTPETLAKLLSQQMPDLHASRMTLTTRLIASNKTTWLNEGTFRVYIDDVPTMTWRRDGLAWRLTSVVVPLGQQ